MSLITFVSPLVSLKPPSKGRMGCSVGQRQALSSLTFPYSPLPHSALPLLNLPFSTCRYPILSQKGDSGYACIVARGDINVISKIWLSKVYPGRAPILRHESRNKGMKHS